LTAESNFPRSIGVIERLRAMLPKGKFARSVSILAGGTATSQALAVLCAPFLTRIYSTQDFGNYQVYFSLLSFAIVVACLRYELAVMLPESETVASNLLAVAFASTLATSIVIAALSVGAHYTTHSLGKIDALRSYIWIFPLTTFAAGIYQALSYWAFRGQSFVSVSRTKIVQIATQIMVQLGLGGLLKFGLSGLLFGDAGGRIVGSVSLMRDTGRRERFDWRLITPRAMWDAAVRYRNFPFISSPAALLSTAGASLPMLLMAQLYGVQVLGWLALADRVMGAPSVLIGQAVSQVYMTEAASLARTDPHGLRTLFRITIRKLVLLPALPCLIVLLFGPSLFALIFGEPWREAGNYARLLVVMHYVVFVAWPFTPTLTVLEHQGQQLTLDILRLALTCASIWGAAVFRQSARNAVFIYGVSYLIGYVAILLASSMAIDRLVRNYAYDRSVIQL
jgi:O-antigen/teichoic acid export membrane protein